MDCAGAACISCGRRPAESDPCNTGSTSNAGVPTTLITLKHRRPPARASPGRNGESRGLGHPDCDRAPMCLVAVNRQSLDGGVAV
jgi:hypothetical protein